MSDPGKPRIRQGIQLVQHDELNAELSVISEDEAASLLWAAQWLDEHREFAVTAIRLDNTADPDDEDDVTTTVVITLHRANEHEPGRLGPWPHGVPHLPCENFLYGFKAARRAARAADSAARPPLPLTLPLRPARRR